MLDHGTGQELLLYVMEALYIQMTPAEKRFNHGQRLEVSGCWTPVMRQEGGGAIFANLQP